MRITIPTLLISALVVLSEAAFAQKTDTWATFAKTKFEPKYVENLQEYIFYPTFPPDLKALDGKEITLEGFYVVGSDEEKYIVLSKVPQAQCFFCGGAGPESVVEVKFKGSQPQFKVDDLITVKGKLKLNSEDLEHLNFMISDAVLVSK